MSGAAPSCGRTPSPSSPRGRGSRSARRRTSPRDSSQSPCRSYWWHPSSVFLPGLARQPLRFSLRRLCPAGPGLGHGLRPAWLPAMLTVVERLVVGGDDVAAVRAGVAVFRLFVPAMRRIQFGDNQKPRPLPLVPDEAQVARRFEVDPAQLPEVLDALRAERGENLFGRE